MEQQWYSVVRGQLWLSVQGVWTAALQLAGLWTLEEAMVYARIWGGMVRQVCGRGDN